MSSRDTELIEKFGLDNSRSLRGLGIQVTEKRNKKKNSIKLYIPRYKLEMFQTYSIYLMMMGYKSISANILELVQSEIEKVELEKSPMWAQARSVLKELKFRKLTEEVNNFNHGDDND